MRIAAQDTLAKVYTLEATAEHSAAGGAAIGTSLGDAEVARVEECLRLALHRADHPDAAAASRGSHHGWASGPWLDTLGLGEAVGSALLRRLRGRSADRGWLEREFVVALGLRGGKALVRALLHERAATADEGDGSLMEAVCDCVWSGVVSLAEGHVDDAGSRPTDHGYPGVGVPSFAGSARGGDEMGTSFLSLGGGGGGGGGGGSVARSVGGGSVARSVGGGSVARSVGGGGGGTAFGDAALAAALSAPPPTSTSVTGGQSPRQVTFPHVPPSASSHGAPPARRAEGARARRALDPHLQQVASPEGELRAGELRAPPSTGVYRQHPPPPLDTYQPSMGGDDDEADRVWGQMYDDARQQASR